MIIDWREKLADKELPFFIVQLANFMQTHPEPVESNWAALREAQRQVALKVPNAALAVAIDLGEWNDIHPLNKKNWQDVSPCWRKEGCMVIKECAQRAHVYGHDCQS